MLSQRWVGLWRQPCRQPAAHLARGFPLHAASLLGIRMAPACLRRWAEVSEAVATLRALESVRLGMGQGGSLRPAQGPLAVGLGIPPGGCKYRTPQTRRGSLKGETSSTGGNVMLNKATF